MQHLAGTSGRSARDIAIAAADRAGEIILAHRGDSAPVAVKGRGNVATIADHAAEAAILDLLRAEFPDHGILAEESGGHESSNRYRWVIDPLDGTFNFSIGLPIYSVSIALLDGDRPMLGVVRDPNRDETFVAERDQGATLNDTLIRVRPTDRLADAVIGYDLGYHDGRGRQAITIASMLWGNVQFFRTIGSAALALAYVAAGRYDLYFHHFVYPWDYAAGWLLIKEAGGIVTAQGGAPMSLAESSIVGANATLHQAFLDAIRHLGPLDP